MPLLPHSRRGERFIDLDANNQRNVVGVLGEEGAERCARGYGMDWMNIYIGIEAAVMP
jgi:hypothetical protein